MPWTKEPDDVRSLGIFYERIQFAKYISWQAVGKQFENAQASHSARGGGGGRERDRKSELEASHPTENQYLPMDNQIWKNIQIDDIIFNFFFFFVAFNLVWVSRKCVDFPDRLNIAEKAGTKKN